jgi:hypothetical protein
MNKSRFAVVPILLSALSACYTIPAAKQPTDADGYAHCRHANEQARTRGGAMFSFGVVSAIGSGAAV